MRINLNINRCGVVISPVHSASLLPLLLLLTTSPSSAPGPLTSVRWPNSFVQAVPVPSSVLYHMSSIMIMIFPLPTVSFTGPTFPDIHTTCSSPVLLSTTETRNEKVGVYWYLFSNHVTRKCIHKRVITTICQQKRSFPLVSSSLMSAPSS